MTNTKLKFLFLFAVLLVMPIMASAQVQLTKVKRLTVKNISINSAYISWNKSRQAKYYQLRLQNGNSENIKTWKKISSNSKNISASMALLSQGNRYQVKVSSCIKHSCSKWSTVKSFNTLTDNDGDGIASTADCNDNNPNVDAYITYYLDDDGDGLGDANNATTICSETAPTGYVVNSEDSNDYDFDNDGYETGSDCNDNDSSKYIIYYEDSDEDGYGNPDSTICAGNTAPSGYRSNSGDTDDSDYFNGSYPGCSNDTYNCDDFSTQFRAQKYFEYCVAQGAGDIHNLDGDADGEACESLN